MRKNVASQVVSAHLVSSTDGSDVTSGTTTVYVTGDGGAQASGGTATHEGNGSWTFLPSQANTNYDHVIFTFENSSAVNVDIQIYPVSYDPTDAADLGLTALTGHTPQTGDNYARLGAPAGASVSADIADVPTVSEFNARTPSSTAATNMDTLFDGVEGFAGAYAGPRGPGVYLNDAAANTNTANGVDGTWSNPVSTIAAAKTIADSLSVDRIYLVNDSAITLAATMTDYEFVGIGATEGNTVALASQDVTGSTFHNVTVTGIQGGAGRALYEDCVFGTATLYCHAKRCGLSDGTTGITFSNNDDNILDACYSMVPGNTAPILICSAANLDLSVRHYSGGLEIQSSNATMTATLEFVGGQVIFNANCNTSSAFTLRGMYSKTDNAGMTALTETAGWPYIQDDDTAVYDRTTDSLQATRDHIGDGTNLTEAGGTGDQLTALATAAALTTAQNDLDTLTGADGATLATAQGNYAPAKAGDEMDLVTATEDGLVDKVWDEAQSGHVGAGSFGLYLDSEVSGAGGGSATDYELTGKWTRDSSNTYYFVAYLKNQTGVLTTGLSNEAIVGVYGNNGDTDLVVGSSTIAVDTGRIYGDFTLGTQPTDDMPAVLVITIDHSSTTYTGHIHGAELT